MEHAREAQNFQVERVAAHDGASGTRSALAGGTHTLTAAQSTALARTRIRMTQGWFINAGPLDRNTLHER